MKARWGAPKKRWHKVKHKARCFLCHPWKKRGRHNPSPSSKRLDERARWEETP